MHPILQECFVDHVVMTTLAEFVALLLESKGDWTAGILMALVAHFVVDRWMYIIPHDRFRAGTVRIVTGDTVCLVYRIIKMLFFECRLPSVMATETECRHTVFQQFVVFSRCMWVMAGETIILHRGMFEFVPLYLLT